VVGLGLFAGTILVGGPLGRLNLEWLFGAAAVGAGLCLGLAFVVPVPGWIAVLIVGIGTLLHGMTQVVTATLLPRGAPTGRAATMTLRGAASSFGSGLGAALGGLLLPAAGYPALGVLAIVCCAGSAALVWWAGASESPERDRAMDRLRATWKGAA
jgi:predicted MFS family arabinose efflux permease